MHVRIKKSMMSNARASIEGAPAPIPIYVQPELATWSYLSVTPPIPTLRSPVGETESVHDSALIPAQFLTSTR